MPYKDPKKAKEYLRLWYLKNKKKKNLQTKNWRLLNNNRYKELSKLNYKNSKQNEPWKIHYKASQQRCTNPNRKGYKYYGGRGIEFLMTLEDFKKLWFRDKAYLMKRPSIDRINPDGHYELENCRFIELIINQSRTKLKRNIKGQFIRRIK